MLRFLAWAACLPEAVGQVHYRHLLTPEKAAYGQLLLEYWLLVVLLGQDRTAEQKLALTCLLRTNVTALGTLASAAYLPGPTSGVEGVLWAWVPGEVLMDTDFPVSDGFQGVTQCEGVGTVQGRQSLPLLLELIVWCRNHHNRREETLAWSDCVTQQVQTVGEYQSSDSFCLGKLADGAVPAAPAQR